MRNRTEVVVLSLTALMGLLMFRCDQPVSYHAADTGTIHGKVIDEKNEGVRGVSIKIDGSNLSATTNDTGVYAFYYVPAGTYVLRQDGHAPDPYRFLEQSITIAVKPGSLSIVPDLVIRQNSSGDRYVPTIPEYYVYSCRGTELTPTPSKKIFSFCNSPPNPNVKTFVTNTRCIRLEFCTVSSLHSLQTPVVLPTMVIHNNDTVYSAVPQKGRVTTGEIRLTGSDTMWIVINDKAIEQFYCFDSAVVSLHDTIHYLDIILGPVSFQTSIHPPPISPYLAENGEFLVPIIETQQCIDWDVYLVSVHTKDTCWWKNKAMKSGYPDNSSQMCKVSLRFLGDERLPRASQHEDFAYIPDRIQGEAHPDGEYDLFVHFFDGPADSMESTPCIHGFMGKSRLTGRIFSRFSSRSERPLKKGETWYAGRIHFSDFLYDKENQRISAP